MSKSPSTKRTKRRTPLQSIWREVRVVSCADGSIRIRPKWHPESEPFRGVLTRMYAARHLTRIINAHLREGNEQYSQRGALIASHLRDFADFLPPEKREDFNATIDDLQAQCGAEEAAQPTEVQVALKDHIYAERGKGNIVVMSLEGPMSIPLEEFVKQPADGILYDLNRSEEVVMTFIHERKWVNDYAVAMTIRKLVQQRDEARAVSYQPVPTNPYDDDPATSFPNTAPQGIAEVETTAVRVAPAAAVSEAGKERGTLEAVAAFMVKADAAVDARRASKAEQVTITTVKP